MNRSLTNEEEQLVRWMLEHGGQKAKEFLPQLEYAKVEPWRCKCGCASFNLSISGREKPSPGMRPIAEYVFGEGAELNGIFVYEKGGILAGLEVYGAAGEASKLLPTPDSLRPWKGVRISRTSNGR